MNAIQGYANGAFTDWASLIGALHLIISSGVGGMNLSIKSRYAKFVEMVVQGVTIGYMIQGKSQERTSSNYVWRQLGRGKT
jgi:hypothetical protein